jgi:hypothetical protein
MRTYRLTLELTMWADAPVLPEPDRLQELADGLVNAWDDGRLPFCSEMAQEGLKQAVRRAIEKNGETLAQERCQHDGARPTFPTKAEATQLVGSA